MESWSDDAVTYSYANRMRSAGAARWHKPFRYVYDAAGNLLHRTNHALVQSAGVDLNQLTNQSRSGKLTVAGTTMGPATQVTVNSSNVYQCTVKSALGRCNSKPGDVFTWVHRKWFPHPALRRGNSLISSSK